MKKSEMYHELQKVVLLETGFSHEERLQILRELFSQEDMAKMVEEAQEKQEAVEG